MILILGLAEEEKGGECGGVREREAAMAQMKWEGQTDYATVRD